MDVFLLENNISEEATEYVNDVLFGVLKTRTALFLSFWKAGVLSEWRGYL